MTLNTSDVAVCCSSDSAQFVEQPRVLNRDNGLVGECGDKLDLLVSEWPDLRSVQRQNTDRDTLAQHRNSEYRAIAPEFLCLDEGVFGISFHVRDMDHPAFEQDSPHKRASVGLDAHIFNVIHEFAREAISFCAVKHPVDLP